MVGVGKGKKREVKRNIPTELIPVEEETWLLQPIAVTMMRHDYSLIQIRILVTIVEFMQNKLHKILNKDVYKRQALLYYSKSSNSYSAIGIWLSLIHIC